MKYLSAILLTCICGFAMYAQHAPVDSIKAYTTFIDKQETPAKTYILDLFKKYDVVVLCERLHGETTQYELIADVIGDPRFAGMGVNVFTEIGLSSLQPALNDFLHTPGLPAHVVDSTIMYFQRNCSTWPTWTNANYNQFMHRMYAMNSGRRAADQINFYPSDLPFSWAGADTARMMQLRSMMDIRDSLMAAQITAVLDHKKSSGGGHPKALVIMNYRHAFIPVFEIRGRKLVNTAGYLAANYPGRVANVLLNTVIPGEQGFSMIQKGKWDAAFASRQKTNTGFDLAGSPFGKDAFDFFPLPNNFRYEQVFTGFVFYNPLEEHRIEEGVEGFADEQFVPELIRRLDLIVIVNAEFKGKMAPLRQMMLEGKLVTNFPEIRKYYQLDTMLEQRRHWLASAGQ